MCLSNTIAQDMDEYQWKNRLVIILTDNMEQEDYLAQLEELKSDSEGMKERKLLVFSTTPNTYRKGVSESEWEKSEKLYKRYKKSDAPFEVLLIGLDGGIKVRKTAIFKTEDLFAMIDGMPMRQSEIKNK